MITKFCDWLGVTQTPAIESLLSIALTLVAAMCLFIIVNVLADFMIKIFK